MSINLTYHRKGDYLIPDLVAPEDIPTGIWGMRRRDYLKRHRNGIYTGMLLSDKLNAHLAEIDQQATEMFEQLGLFFANLIVYPLPQKNIQKN